MKNVIIASRGSFNGTLAIMTIREHLCGYYQNFVDCVEAGTYVDPETGHTVCLACNKITAESGLRECDICEREYINKRQYENPNYECVCPECVEKYDL